MTVVTGAGVQFVSAPEICEALREICFWCQEHGFNVDKDRISWLLLLLWRRTSSENGGIKDVCVYVHT